MSANESRLLLGPVALADPDAMRDFGVQLARMLRAGDLVLLDGPLGAGKTTLTQGIAAGLKVRGPINSPTFVIARVHPSLTDGPALVHVDAYRLGGTFEVDDLDLDTSVEASVTVVEWGTGRVEMLSSDRLEVSITRGSSDQADDDVRHVTVLGIGERWLS
jgi:tRNA threonylcarbamoyladenosine biosynthesis protein TsaE